MYPVKKGALRNVACLTDWGTFSLSHSNPVG